MKIDTTEKWLPVYEALGSDVRLKIIGLLSEREMNIKELADALHLSSAIMTMHVKKLEKAQIVKSLRINKNGAVQKLCSLDVDYIEILFPNKNTDTRQFHEFSIPVGHYTDISVTPTCGIASSEKIIGHFDDPRYFLDTERVNAQILWFGEGYVEYKIPNYLLSVDQPEELEISMELSSEAPGVNNTWPSDITFSLNSIKIGMWTSPGDFGGKRGKYTPEWWRLDVGQFGIYKSIHINGDGTFIDGIKVSEIKLADLDIRQNYWTFRISVLPESEHVGGVTIFGKGFGNYDQDIIFKLYYK